MYRVGADLRMSHHADDPLSHLQKSHDQQRRDGKGNEAGSVGNRQMSPKWLNPASAPTYLDVLVREPPGDHHQLWRICMPPLAQRLSQRHPTL